MMAFKLSMRAYPQKFGSLTPRRRVRDRGRNTFESSCGANLYSSFDQVFVPYGLYVAPSRDALTVVHQHSLNTVNRPRCMQDVKQSSTIGALLFCMSRHEQNSSHTSQPSQPRKDIIRGSAELRSPRSRFDAGSMG
ncbi:unnamed protein product [Sphacelaria rigidula]